MRQIAGSRVGVIVGPGALAALGQWISDARLNRVLVVTDPGIKAAGHLDRALQSLRNAGVVAGVFDRAQENPTTLTVDAALSAARDFGPDMIVGLGGGSAMDTAKGVNFVLTNGGRMHDYQGVGRASRAMLPMVAIPTTAGTGSEAQSAALITDPETHVKMACLDPKALPVMAILDPELARTAPRGVIGPCGIDAVAHAVETSGCSRRTDISRRLSKQAWTLLSGGAFERLLDGAGEQQAWADMQLGAHLAGAAIENSMLGAAHACANPLTARYGTTHGIAVGLMLPHVIRFNSADGESPYADLNENADSLAEKVQTLAAHAGLPARLRDLGIAENDLRSLAQMASTQWTATFNPRPVDATSLLDVYRAAW